MGTLPITDSWSLLGRVGAAYAQTKGTCSGTGVGAIATTETNKRETNCKYGFGTQYAFTPALTLRLEGERYRVNDAVGQRANVDLISLGLVYRFGGSSPVTKTAYTPSWRLWPSRFTKQPPPWPKRLHRCRFSCQHLCQHRCLHPRPSPWSK